MAEFHRDARVLKQITPAPIFVQFHRVDAWGEGSIAEFTLWFGLWPVRWTARHSKVDPPHGFTDTQIAGPMQHWVHTHVFTAEGRELTRVHDHIEFEHYRGWRGLLPRLLFAPFALRLLFNYRRLATRRALESKQK